MDVSEYRGPDFSASCYEAQKFLAVLKTNLIKPLAADGQGRVMQTNQNMFGFRLFEYGLQSFHFMIIDAAGGFIVDATIDSGNEPCSICDRVTVMKFGTGKRIFHQVANIVIAGHAIHRQSEGKHCFAKALVSLAAVVLNQVAGHRHHVGVPA